MNGLLEVFRIKGSRIGLKINVKKAKLLIIGISEPHFHAHFFHQSHQIII